MKLGAKVVGSVILATGILLYSSSLLSPTTATPSAAKFIQVAWDANPPEDQVEGYCIYLGVQAGIYAGKVRMDLVHYLHGTCQVPVLINHPETHIAISAYGLAGEGPLSDEVVWTEP